MTLELNSFKD